MFLIQASLYLWLWDRDSKRLRNPSLNDFVKYCQKNIADHAPEQIHEATQKKLIGHTNYQPVSSELLPL
jgi:hypothetical protein